MIPEIVLLSWFQFQVSHNTSWNILCCASITAVTHVEPAELADGKQSFKNVNRTTDRTTATVKPQQRQEITVSNETYSTAAVKSTNSNSNIAQIMGRINSMTKPHNAHEQYNR